MQLSKAIEGYIISALAEGYPQLHQQVGRPRHYSASKYLGYGVSVRLPPFFVESKKSNSIEVGWWLHAIRLGL